MQKINRVLLVALVLNSLNTHPSVLKMSYLLNELEKCNESAKHTKTSPRECFNTVKSPQTEHDFLKIVREEISEKTKLFKQLDKELEETNYTPQRNILESTMRSLSKEIMHLRNELCSIDLTSLASYSIIYNMIVTGTSSGRTLSDLDLMAESQYQSIISQASPKSDYLFVIDMLGHIEFDEYMALALTHSIAKLEASEYKDTLIYQQNLYEKLKTEHTKALEIVINTSESDELNALIKARLTSLIAGRKDGIKDTKIRISETGDESQKQLLEMQLALDIARLAQYKQYIENISSTKKDL